MYYQGRGLWSSPTSTTTSITTKTSQALAGAGLPRRNCRDRKAIGSPSRATERRSRFLQHLRRIYMVLGLGGISKPPATRSLSSRKSAPVSWSGLSPQLSASLWTAAHERHQTSRDLAALPQRAHALCSGEGVDTAHVRANILERHWRPGSVLPRAPHDRWAFKSDLFRTCIVSGWHSIQAAWMSMDDACAADTPHVSRWPGDGPDDDEVLGGWKAVRACQHDNLRSAPRSRPHRGYSDGRWTTPSCSLDGDRAYMRPGL
jgi:hypothetical protein